MQNNNNTTEIENFCDRITNKFFMIMVTHTIRCQDYAYVNHDYERYSDIKEYFDVTKNKLINLVNENEYLLKLRDCLRNTDNNNYNNIPEECPQLFNPKDRIHEKLKILDPNGLQQKIKENQDYFLQNLSVEQQQEHLLQKQSQHIVSFRDKVIEECFSSINGMVEDQDDLIYEKVDSLFQEFLQ